MQVRNGRLAAIEDLAREALELHQLAPRAEVAVRVDLFFLDARRPDRRALVDQREDARLDELDQPFEHLRFAGEVSVQGRFAHRKLGGQRGGGHTLAARLLEHAGQRLQDLHAALAGLGPLAGRGAGGIGIGGLGGGGLDSFWVFSHLSLCRAASRRLSAPGGQ